MIAPGPWAQHFWRMLGLPDAIDIRTPAGEVEHDVRMWTYWNLQEGEITVDPLMFATADGGAPPVIHLDTDAPLRTDDGRLITDELWGIYYKRDRHGVQGGASPLTVDGDVELDPYPSTTNVDDEFPDMWCAALSHAMSRFEGCRPLYKQARSGGVGSFTADNFPVFDYLKPNVLRDPRLEPRLQDDRRRPRGREGALRVSIRACSTPSASSASRPATSTPSRTRRIPGRRRRNQPAHHRVPGQSGRPVREVEPLCEPPLRRRLKPQRDDDRQGHRRHELIRVRDPLRHE